jgi:hypothetical protein
MNWLFLAFISFLQVVPHIWSLPCNVCLPWRLHIVGHPRPQVSWNCQLPVVVCLNYWVPIHSVLELIAPCGGMPEPLAPQMTSINGRSRFLTTGGSLPPVAFLVYPGCQILSALWGGMPELLAPCWEGSTFRWRLCVRELLYMTSAL